MKASYTLVASVVVAASTAALTTTSSSNVAFHPCSNEEWGRRKGSRQMSGGDKDKFAPRFDGLRFIETLVTAHR